jgi:hypothetical protein
LKSVSAENGVPATSVAGSSTRARVSTLPWIQPPCTAKWSVIGLDGHAFDGGSAALPRPVASSSPQINEVFSMAG